MRFSTPREEANIGGVELDRELAAVAFVVER